VYYVHGECTLPLSLLPFIHLPDAWGPAAFGSAGIGGASRRLLGEARIPANVCTTFTTSYGPAVRL